MTVSRNERTEPFAAPSGDGKRYLALDSLRGLAALGVLFYHVDTFGLIASLPLFRNGWLFVDFFFVLSGFVIAAAYGERLAHGFSRRTFLFRRWGRTYPLHIAMVLAYVVLEFSVERPVVGEAHGADQLLSAVFLLDGYWAAHNYYNGVSWSISVEFFAYACAALLAGTGKKGMAITVAMVAAAAWGLVSGIDGPVFTTYLQRCIVGFAAGTACFALYRRTEGGWSPRVASLAEGAMIVLAGAAMVYAGDGGAAILPCALVFAGAVFVFAREEGVLSRLLCTKPFVALGAWSYSIYMVHMLVIAVMNRGFELTAKWAGRTDLLRHAGDVEGLRRIALSPLNETLVSLLACAVSIGIASQTYRWIEEPGRRWAKARARAAGAAGAERIAPTI